MTLVLQNGITFRHVTSSGEPGMLADLHCHNGMELLYVLSGNMAHVAEGRCYQVSSGDLVLAHPSQYHYLEQLSNEPYERYNIIFDPQLHGIDISLIPKELEVIHLKSGSVAASLFGKMDYYFEQVDNATFSVLLHQMLVELMINLRLISHQRKREASAISPVLKAALDYINGNLYTVSGVEEVANALYISPSYLFRLFRESLHQSPKRYIRDKRLLAAQRRIRRGMTPTAACKECGFKEYATFFRSYTAFFGHSPSQDKAPQELL